MTRTKLLVSLSLLGLAAGMAAPAALFHEVTTPS